MEMECEDQKNNRISNLDWILAQSQHYYQPNFICIDLSRKSLKTKEIVGEELTKFASQFDTQINDDSVIGINLCCNFLNDELIEYILGKVYEELTKHCTKLTKDSLPIQEVYLTANSLTEIPKCLENLKNTLEVLILNRNSIQELSPILTSFTKLRRLELQGNRISEVVREYIEPLQDLEYVSLSCNCISNIDDFPKLPKLKFLGLFGNYLGQEYDEVKDLTITS